MDFKPYSFYSGALNRREVCYVQLPTSYDHSEKNYPVIYLLHGRDGNETDWIYQGQANTTIDKMCSQGQLRECIIVMPSDGGYDRGTFYSDWYDGSGNFEQNIIDDLIPFIDEQFRTIPSREARVIGGLSMGGYGSFMLAMRHPELFGAAASLSGALDKFNNAPEYELARIYGPFNGPYCRGYNLLHLSKEVLDQPNRPELYFDCGTEDFLYEWNQNFKAHLEKINYPFQYNDFPGEHNWEYWIEHLTDALTFFEAYFSQ